MLLAIATSRVAAVSVMAASQPVSAGRPNIVHIFTDDLGQQDVECYREGRKSLYETPNMDRLAKRGMRFTDAYSPAPTCAPSRAAFLTGQYGPHNGVLHVMGGILPRPLSQDFRYIAPFYSCRVPADANTVPRILSQAGYVTAHIKKLHVGGRGNSYPYPVTYGFDFSWGKNHDYNDPELWDKNMKHKQEYINGLWLPMQPDRLHGFATSDPDDPYRTDPADDDRPFDGTVDLALRWMKKVAPGDKPFFLNYCTSMVHGPLSARDRKRFEYYCKKLGIPVPTKLGSVNKEHSGQKNPYYATMVDTTDWIVGKLVSYLEETDDPRNPGHKLIDNTYIVLSTDNGGCTGIPTKNESCGNEYEQVTDNSPLRGGKQTPYEGGVRIPFIVSGPSIKAGTVSDAVVSLIDLFPTFMDMANMEPQPELDLDGCSILPVLHAKSATPHFADGTVRESLFFHYPVEMPMSSSVRKGNWKLYLNIGPGVNQSPDVELFRLKNDDGSKCDVSEKNNLAKRNPQKRDELLKELHAWLKKYDAAMPAKNPDFNLRTLENQDKAPKITGRGSNGDTVWVTCEKGKGKAKIASAILLYTLNPKETRKPHQGEEEWFQAPAVVNGSRVEAVAPPGMTHGVLYLLDENNFSVTSEKLPQVNEVNYSNRDSSYLKYAFKYKPGLYSMITCAESAVQNAKKKKLNTSALNAAIIEASKTVVAPVEVESYAEAVRTLRREIRALDVPEAKLPVLSLIEQKTY